MAHQRWVIAIGKCSLQRQSIHSFTASTVIAVSLANGNIISIFSGASRLTTGIAGTRVTSDVLIASSRPHGQMGYPACWTREEDTNRPS